MKRILILVDDSKNSRAVVPTLQNLAGLQDDLILIHVEKLDEKAEKILAHYKKELEDVNFLNITTIIRAGDPAEEILKAADEENADLILIGNNIKGSLNSLLTESVASDVKQNAEAPVVMAERPMMCKANYTWRDAYTAIIITALLVLGMFILGILL